MLGSVSAGLEEEEGLPALDVQPQTQGAHLQRPPPRLAEVEKMKNARLHSRRQPQTQGARFQRPPPRLAAMKNPS